jgi:hypothetical protein
MTVEIRTDGRWGGRVTQRELPVDDPAIPALSRSDREELALHWLARGASERRVGDAFEVILRVLREAQAPSELIQLAERAVDDEHRHAELSRIVASRFAGRDLPAPELLPLSLPRHEGATDSLKRTLYVVGQCCFNETFASAVLENSLRAARGRLAQAALRELLSDEIDHARMGWAHVSTLDTQQRKVLSHWLIPLAQANVRMWRETPRDYPTSEHLVEHGALSREMIDRALSTALRELVAPGFRELGVDTSVLEDYLGSPH